MAFRAFRALAFFLALALLDELELELLDELELELFDEFELELLDELFDEFELELLDELELELLDEFELELPAEADSVPSAASIARTPFSDGAEPPVAAPATTSPQAPSPAYVFQRFPFVLGVLGSIVDLASVGYEATIVPGARETNVDTA